MEGDQDIKTYYPPKKWRENLSNTNVAKRPNFEKSIFYYLQDLKIHSQEHCEAKYNPHEPLTL